MNVQQCSIRIEDEGTRVFQRLATLQFTPETGIGLHWGKLPFEYSMPHDQKIVVVMPAYNAAKTLRMTYADLPRDWWIW